MGPLQTNDMSGLDVCYAIRKRRGTKFHIADAIVEAGRLGQKTGAGYYRYEPGSRTPIPDPETTCVIESVSASLGIDRREISREEMAERMIRSDEHTSELPSLMRISYAVFFLKKTKIIRISKLHIER